MGFEGAHFLLRVQRRPPLVAGVRHLPLPQPHQQTLPDAHARGFLQRAGALQLGGGQKLHSKRHCRNRRSFAS